MRLSTPLSYDGDPRAAADAVVALGRQGVDSVRVPAAIVGQLEEWVS